MARAKNARPRPCQAGDQCRASHQGFLPRQLAPQVLGPLAARDFTHRAPHVQAVARRVLPGPSPSLGAAGGRGGNLLAAGSNRLQTRFRRLHTGFWTWLYRFDAGPGPEGHLDPFMSAGSRGQLAPGPAAESLPPANWLPCSPTGPWPPWSSRTPACHRRHAPMSLPPANWLPCSPTGPWPPWSSCTPPACQLARLSSRGMSLRVAGPSSTAPTSSISPSPAGCTTGRSAFTLVAPGVPGVSEPSPSTAPALPGSLMGVFSQIEPRIGLTLSDS